MSNTKCGGITITIFTTNSALPHLGNKGFDFFITGLCMWVLPQKPIKAVLQLLPWIKEVLLHLFLHGGKIWISACFIDPGPANVSIKFGVVINVHGVPKYLLHPHKKFMHWLLRHGDLNGEGVKNRGRGTRMEKRINFLNCLGINRKRRLQ